MGFGDFKDKAQNMGKEHGDKISQGMDKIGEKAKEKFGHEDKIDQAMEKGKDMFGGGSQGEEGQEGQQDRDQQQ
ncbi:antitoxin [Allosaccharopolyspora coralli]|uniref:Antitoxin n=1 Tax=Allosaccharopolyspora coralli TaxID=2665642 RepID=A0A5Q3Q154_9PSEU|nr:antitoxin [Allosaccharopolyspora coralli]QGK68328.1 antitoxin [Allosaccharopolyspora coralli]